MLSRTDSKETLYSRLNMQTCTRKLTKLCVPVMVARLGQNWTAASSRCAVLPIFQTMVVDGSIGGIETHEEYEELRAASTKSEYTLLQQMRETNNRGAKAFRDRMRDLVIPFFKDNDNKIRTVRDVKWELFGISADHSLLSDEHPIAKQLAALPRPEINGTVRTVRDFADSSPDRVRAVLQVKRGSLCFSKQKRTVLNRQSGWNRFAPPSWAMAVYRPRRPL